MKDLEISFFILSKGRSSPTLFTSSSSWNAFVWSTSWGSHSIFVSDQSHVTDKPVICSTIPATCLDSGGSWWWTLCLSQMLLTYETKHTILLDNVSLAGKITFQFICQWTSLVSFHIFLFDPLVPAYRLTPLSFPRSHWIPVRRIMNMPRFQILSQGDREVLYN